MSEYKEYCVQNFGSSGYFTKSCDTKLSKEDSLETDAVPPNEAIPKSQEMRRQIQPFLDKTNQPDHENANSFENGLCNEVSKMQITSADDKQVQILAQSEGQNDVLETNTPELLQHDIREGEHQGHDVKGRRATARGAGGGSGSASEVQTATTTPQDSPPPTTKPKFTAVETSQTNQQGQVPHTPIQELTSQPLLKPTSQTPDLVQHDIREGEHQGHDVKGRCASAGGAGGGSGKASGVNRYWSHQSEIEAKVQATPFDDDCNQTATTTPQESPPPTTKPQFTAVETSQDQGPHTLLLKPTFQEPPEEDDEHYDVLLLHSEHDQREAQQFFGIAKKANWKVATPDDFRLTQTKFKSFEDVYKNSSYTVLLLTSNFIADVWCNHRYQTALTQSIENPAKRCTVIPVICQYQDLKMPMELSIFTSAKLNNPRIEKILQRCIKVGKRLQREKEAGLTTMDAAPNHVATLKSKDEKVSLSMDAIYHQLRPELQPGTSAAQIMSSHCFSGLCVRLDAPHPLYNDWQRLASNLGFSSQSGLHQEKSPTAKILECFFQREIAMKRSKDGILLSLMQILNGMQRRDVVEFLLMDGK